MGQAKQKREDELKRQAYLKTIPTRLLCVLIGLTVWFWGPFQLAYYGWKENSPPWKGREE